MKHDQLKAKKPIWQLHSWFQGACSDSFAAAGQTGSNPPSICGTNTGYHSNCYVIVTQHKIILGSVKKFKVDF